MTAAAQGSAKLYVRREELRKCLITIWWRGILPIIQGMVGDGRLHRHYLRRERECERVVNAVECSGNECVK